MTFSKESPPRLAMCPKYFIIWLLTWDSKCLFGCISSRTLMFDLFINQEMRNIRRQHHISKEVILDWSAFVNVQDSHPYVAIGNISAETRRFFVALVMPLSVQILFRPAITDLAIAIRLRSSVEQPLLVVISDPRKLNCVTCSTSVPSTAIGSSFPSLPTIMILVLLTFSRRPRALLLAFTRSSCSFNSNALVATRVVSSAYRRLLSL